MNGVAPETYPHMAAGWAVMFDTPYKWTKQMGSDYGGNQSGHGSALAKRYSIGRRASYPISSCN
ncbi:MAG: hypothetical protein R2764_03965 [Bacteroidales bacterium]